MLRLYLDEVPSNVSVILDAEKQFNTLKLGCTEDEKRLVQTIEGSRLIDSNSFIDRFGYKLYNTELSTGCKAALCVLHCKNDVIDLAECGLNARDAIISLCTDGAICIDTNSATISNKYSRGTIEVQVGNYLFTDINRLNTYIFDEYPYKPDLNTVGIKELN